LRDGGFAGGDGPGEAEEEHGGELWVGVYAGVCGLHGDDAAGILVVSLIDDESCRGTNEVAQ
jgi:hypothetical protein